MEKEFIGAIDIGTTKIVAIIGRKNTDGKLKILGMGTTPSMGVKRGVVLNMEETANSIRKAVEKAEEEANLKFKKDVYVGIAGQHIKSIRNRGYKNRDSYDDEITQEHVTELIEDMYKIPIEAGEEIIHVIPQSYIVDNETGIKNPIGMSGKRLEADFHIVIGHVSSARNIQRCVKRVGLNVKSLILEPIASSAAVLSEDEKEAGVALVDIGGGTTDIAVFYDKIIRHTAVVPFGGNVVTADIKEGCAILQRQAEALKKQFGSCISENVDENNYVTVPGISGRESKEISFKSLSYIIEARIEEIIEIILYEIENSGFIEKLSAGLVITGGGSLLKELPELLKYRTGLDVRIGYPGKNLSDDNEEINHTKYSTSIGLILASYKELEEEKKTNSYKKNLKKIKKEEKIKKEIVLELEEEKEEENIIEEKVIKNKEIKEEIIEEFEEEKKLEIIEEKKTKTMKNRFNKWLENIGEIFEEKDSKF